MMLLMLLGFSIARANEVEIGDGTQINSASLPISTTDNYSVSQQIFTSNEINVTGTITDISFFKTSPSSETRSIEIYMVPTAVSSFGSSNPAWIPVTAEDLVFSGEVTFAEGTGWNKIKLNAPYEYNKSRNLAVVVHDKTGAPTSDDIYFQTTEQSACKALLALSNSSDINPTNIGSASLASLTDRSRIQLSITPVKKGTVKVGDGVKSVSYLPASRGGHKYAITQQIYTADEIGTAGVIKSISFKTSSQNFDSSGFSGKWELYLVHTSKSEFTSDYDWVSFSEANKVYSGSLSFTAANYLQTYKLDTPFEYDGISNLALIAVKTESGNSSSAKLLVYDAPKQAHGYSTSISPIDNSKLYDYSATPYDVKNQVWFDIDPLTIIGGAGDGTSNMLPTATDYKYAISEQIYTSAEIGRSGFITGINFYCTNSSTSYVPYRTVKLYVAKTDKTQFNNDRDWYIFNPSDLVFQGTIFVYNKSWIKVTFDKPLKYNGSDNLIIGFVDVSGSNNTASNFRVYNTEDHQSLSKTNDKPFDPTDAGADALKLEYGYNDKVKNQIFFSFQEEWQIGEGDAINNYLPTYTFYNYSITQQVYTASEMGKSESDITSISFFNTGDSRTRELEIYMTSPTAFTKYPANYAKDVVPTPADMVFSGTVTFESGVWTDIPLNKAFKYVSYGGGTHSLVLTVVDKTGSWESSTQFLTYETEEAQTIYAHSDNTPYTLDDLGIFGLDERYTLKKKNQIQFNNVPVNPKPVGLHASLLGFTSAKVAWYGEAGTNGWNFEFREASETEWTHIGLPSSITYYQLENLKENATYYIRVQSVSGSETSDWTTSEFNTSLMPTRVYVTNITPESATVMWSGPGSKWNLYYRIYDDEDWTTVAGLTTKSYELTGLKQNTDYQVIVYGTDGEKESGGYVVADFTTAEDPLFLRPENIEVTEITTHTAIATWDEMGTATSWQIEVWGDDDNEEDYLYYTANTKPFILTGLQQSKGYNIKVRGIVNAENGVYGNWSYVEYFTTQNANPAPTVIAVSTTPNSATITWEAQSDSYKVRYRKTGFPFFFEGFEYTDITALQSKGWTLKKMGDAPTDTGWEITTNGYNNEGVTSYSWSSTAGAYDADNWLITPLLDLQGVLSYWENSDASYLENYEVLLSMTGTEIEDFTTTLRPLEVSTGVWSREEIDLSAYEGQQGYIAFHHKDYDKIQLYLDDIGIFENVPWTTIETADKTVTIDGLEASYEYEFEVIGVAKGCEDASSGIKSFTLLPSNPVPFDVAVVPDATAADISWIGYGDDYVVEYREVSTGFSDNFQTGSPYVGPVSTKGWTVYTEGEHLEGKEGWFAATDDGNIYASSRSYYNGVRYSADNWLVTPKVALGGTLKFKVQVDKNYQDSYEVVLSTVGNTVADLKSGIILRKMGPAGNTTYGWEEVTIDLSSYDGQEGYIAIHHVDYDKNYLYIDDFIIDNPHIYYGDWKSVEVFEQNCRLEGLTPKTTYEFTITSRKYDETSVMTYSYTFSTTGLDPVDLVLDNNGQNSAIISANHNAYANVTIDGLTLYADEWTAINLPFDVDVENSVLAGASVRTLNGGAEPAGKYHVIDCQSPVTFMDAGFPYLVKLASGSISNPTFKRVMLNMNTAESGTTAGNVTFKGSNYDAYEVPDNMPTYYSVYTYENAAWLSPILMGHYRSAFEPFFRIDLGYDDAIFILNTGDNDMVTGLSSLKQDSKDEVIYNLAGQRLGKVQKGVNIVNGKKVLVK